ncbi:MAG: hypothetical protein DMF68_16065 [Acidobacteria bacterium]|nr:MAG: hypothetical protein DMF68_16065 [Acidobacteriota bacterium]
MNLTESSDEVTTQNILSEPPKPDSIVSHAVPLRQEITLSRIRTDGGTQPRAQLNFLTIDEYAEAMQEGAKFPPVTLFYDGSEYWLADGFHRVAAARKAGRETIDCEVTQGTRRDAVLYSLGANATHGLPRTNEDKRRAVKMLLEDKEWAEWSDSLIAQKTSTSQPFVSKLRRELFPESAARTVRRGADNIVRDTARIGARDKDSTEETSPLFEKPEGLAVSDSGEDVETEESKTDAPPSQDAEQTEPPKEQAKAKIVEDGIALTADPQPPAHNEPVSAEQEKAWEKAQIEIKIQIMRADGHLEGRRVMIIAHEEGGLPLTKIERSTDSVLPGLNALLSLINTLKAELPLRLSKKTDATKPSQKPATATKKKPTRATKKAATKKPAARKSTKKQSTKVEGAK